MNFTLFIALVILLNLLCFMQNHTRDLTSWFDFIVLASNILALISTMVLLFKEKQMIHQIKHEKDKEK